MSENDAKTKTNDRDGAPVAPTTAETADSGAMPIDLARLGLNEIAYIKQAIVNDKQVWAIFNASGDPVGAAQSFDQAWGAVHQHDMAPSRVH